MECRIILVDDHSLFRNGLRGLLERNEGFRVVGEASSGEEFLSLLEQESFAADIVFMDFSMPGLDGAQTTERALARRPDLRIITLSMFGEESYYSRMVEAGARGFLLKDSDIGDVLEAIAAVMGGGSYFSPRLLSSLTGRMHAREHDELADDQLSSREREILVAVCRGTLESGDRRRTLHLETHGGQASRQHPREDRLQEYGQPRGLCHPQRHCRYLTGGQRPRCRLRPPPLPDPLAFRIPPRRTGCME